MKKFLMGLSFAVLAAAAWALPTVQQVEAEVQQGHYAQAETMMKEVVAAKPESAKGHYVYAELLAHNGNFSAASSEAAKARQLDPAIKFADPDKFRSFEQLLQREQNPRPRAESNSGLTPAAVAPATPVAAAGGGVPGWIWLVGLAVIAWVLWRGFARSRAAAPANASMNAPMNAPMSGAAYGGNNPGPGYGQPVPNPGMPGAPYGSPYGQPAAPAAGGGLLRTGAAVAGGVAAGMLVDEMINRHQQGGVGGLGGLGGSGNLGGGNTDSLSGLQRGVFDGPQNDNAANELENRNVDFGNGADWDTGGGAGPDLDVGGGGGDDSGGGWD